MRLSSVARLYRVRLRARLTQELFAVLGIAIGVSLLFASQVANTSLNGSVRELTSGIVGQMRFQLAARDTHGFDAQLLNQVVSLPGVQAAAPVLEQNANVVGPAGEQSVDLVGADPRLARLGGRLARRLGTVPLGGARVFTLPAPIARKLGVSSSLQPVKLQVGSAEVSALLVSEQLAGRASALGQSPVALAPLRTVQKLTGMSGRLTSIFVRSPPRLDGRVRAELQRLAAGRLNVRPAGFNTVLFARAAGPVNQSTGLFSALSALVGFLFAFNALLLTVPQRRNLIEDLRLDGYTRRMIVEVLLLDALVLGVLASALGLLLGEVLSAALFSASPGYLSFAFPIGAQRIVTGWSIALAVAGGMLAACAGVLAPLRAEIVKRPARFSRAPVGTPHARAWWLLTGASVCLAATTVILLVAPQAAIVGVLSLTAALLLCLPAVLDLAVRAAERLQRMLKGASSYLAVIELRSRSNRARSLAIAATGAIAVFGSVSIQGARGSLQRGLDASARGIDSRARSVGHAGGRVQLLRHDTVQGHDRRRARATRGRTGRGDLSRELPGLGAIAASGSSRLPAATRSRSRRARSSAATRPWRAPGCAGTAGWCSRGRSPPATICTSGRRSPCRARIRPACASRRSAPISAGPGALVMNADDYAHAWGSNDPSAYQIELAAGATAATVTREVRGALGPRSGLRVETMAERERLHYATAAQGVARLTQIRSLVLIAAVLAMAAAMGAMIWQRRARLADMKVDGFSRIVLWRALLWESAMLLGVGCSLGALFGLYGQLLLSRALSVVNGFPGDRIHARCRRRSATSR